MHGRKSKDSAREYDIYFMTLPIQSTIDLNHYMLGESTLKIMMPGDLITK